MPPIGSELAAIEQKVLKRAGWILRKQREFETYPNPISLPRRYVSSEVYRYLGRQYRLKIVESDVERVTLSRGFLTVSVREPNDKTRIAKMLESWYPSQAPRVFNQRLEVCFPRVEALGIAYPQMMIRDMKARWGSCSSKGNITLNLKLVQASKTLIDYVILHELCHLKEHNHSSKFHSLLDCILPDWRKRREQLNRLEIVWR